MRGKMEARVADRKERRSGGCTTVTFATADAVTMSQPFVVKPALDSCRGERKSTQE